MNSQELKRPEKIELLISHREGRLAPQRLKIVGDLVLWDSPLGKTVAGAHPELLEMVDMAAYESKTHFARSMRTAAVKYEEIFEKAKAPCITKMSQEGKNHVAETKSSLASDGTALVQPASQSVEVVAVANVNPEGRR